MLGMGLVEVPPVPYRDPATAVLANPQVLEHKRFCSRCGEPVGRSRNGQPDRPVGYCRNCGTRFSFTPKLRPGDVVAGQYQVLGCIAHGGLGWIYLARDHNVSDRWVVLKGLLDTGDADAMAAALAERQFLARVEHPNIVKIYNFVQHPDPDTGALTGYIVMEYVGGQSLKEMAGSRRQADGHVEPMPTGQAIAYAIEMLRALGYLHGLGLVYCDFKPENVIQSEEQLKLIDLGGVRRINDEQGAIYGTVGYQAPEIAADGPSVSSDLYTVARALAVLTFEFKGFTTDYVASLPSRDQVPLLARHESFDRLLRRATDHDPARRFGSAAEMAEQLTGVLREVLAAQDGQPRPAASTVFVPEVRTVGPGLADIPAPVGTASGRQARKTERHSASAASNQAGPNQAGPNQAGAPFPPPPPDPAAAAAGLPVPLLDGTDPAAGFLAGLGATANLIELLSDPPIRSSEVSLRLAKALIDAGELSRADEVLADMAATDPDDWRVDWYRGLAELAAGHLADAWDLFDGMYGLLPGEAAPKLALGLIAELAGDPHEAARHYELVWNTDHSFVTAAFGLARVRLALADRAGAVAVLESVPASSIHFTQAQVAAIAARIRGLRPEALSRDDVVEAGQRLEALGLDAKRRERLEAEVLESALALTLSASGRPTSSPGAAHTSQTSSPGHTGSPDGTASPGRHGTILGQRLTERELRLGLERAYRVLAHLADDADERIALVELANSVRPRTLI
jgi:serine/threonine-protein kinase PknG